MVKKASCPLTRTGRRVSDLSELMNAPLCAEASFYRRHALMIGATTSEREPPQIRHPHLSRARDRGIVKPTPRKWAMNLGAAASGLSARRHVGTRVALRRSLSAPVGMWALDRAAPNGLIDPPSRASSPQAKSPDSRDSSSALGFSDSSPRSPLDFGLDMGALTDAQINVFIRDKQTTASTTASLDLLAPLAGLSCGQTSADLIEHLEQLVCH